MNTEPVHLISLGAGVQSSTMALMAAHGEITPMPKAAIFADTQNEPVSVMQWLDDIEEWLPFPVHRVSKGNLESSNLKLNAKENARLTLPVFMDDGTTIGRNKTRACTIDYKIKPLTQAARKLAGVKRGEKSLRVMMWLGISTDEVTRCKPNREPWIKNRWPLIEKRISREQCRDWMKHNGYPDPPRSACYYCPFHSDHEWRRLQTEEPLEFDKAVEMERELQEVMAKSRNVRKTPYLHKSCKPLDTIDFRSDVERGQQLLPGWQDECEGMCGI